MFQYDKLCPIVFLLVICVGISNPAKSNTEKISKSNLMSCSAYHLKAKLYYQYFDKEKYKYHKEYFDALNKIFMKKYHNISQTSFILSITSIMESWEYLSQEKGENFANNKINRDYKDLCNSLIN